MKRHFVMDKKTGSLIEVERRIIPQGIPGYPMASDFAGVHPSQVAEQAAHDRAAGVPTQYTTSGEPIWESRSHKKKWLRANGLYDRSAGYGDAAPLNR